MGTSGSSQGREPSRTPCGIEREANCVEGGEAVGAPADCTDLAAVEGMRRRAEEELGPVGIVAAFVGGGRARPGPLAQTTEEEWHSTVHANLTATFLTLKSFLPGMIERGSGSIVT